MNIEEKPYSNRSSIVICATSGFCAVALGAFGAHGLETFLQEAGHTGTWETAVRYQMWHTLAILALAGSSSLYSPWIVRLWGTGILLFSGSLYVLSLGAPGWIGAITPIGGLAFLGGWGMLLKRIVM